MKRFFLLLTAGLVTMTAAAQNYDNAKTLLMLNQYDKAKAEVDKGMNNAKYAAKPEACRAAFESPASDSKKAERDAPRSFEGVIPIPRSPSAYLGSQRVPPAASWYPYPVVGGQP